MLISIAIPAFNKADELCELLDSIIIQERPNIEIIICEDCSPERRLIEKKVKKYKKIFSNLKFFKNRSNLGYDRNLRNVIKKSSGQYVLLCGNDDILPPNALSIIERKLLEYKPVALLRSYKSFYKTLNKSSKLNMHRYVSKDTLIEIDEKECAWLFYRTVLVSGLVIDRELANKHSSSDVDGMFYYQNFIISQISKYGKILYVPDILVYNRLVDYGYFGSSKIEKKLKPGQRTIDSSLYQMECFFKCADIAASKRGLQFVGHLRKIASAYSFHLLAYHRDKGILEFIRYFKGLKEIGYRGPYFKIYQIFLIFFGRNISLKLINFIKFLLGHTIRLVR